MILGRLHDAADDHRLCHGGQLEWITTPHHHIGDRALLERVAKKTGLSRAELLRRGLRSVASVELADEQPGSAFEYLVESGIADDGPPDLSARPDDYLNGGEYRQWFDERAAAKRAKRGRVR